MKKNVPLLLLSLSLFMKAEAKDIPSSLFDKVSASGLQQTKPMSASPICRHMGDVDSSKDGDAGAVKSEVFNRTRYKCCLEDLNFYVKAFGGANFLQSTTINGNHAHYQTGYIIAGSFGYSWRYYGLRFEGEYAYRRNAISKITFLTQGSSKDGHFKTFSYMANLLWDLPLCSWGCTFWKIQPFLGAGIGYDSQKMHASNSRIVFHQHWNHVAWQAMAGLAYQILPHTEISLEYKFHHGNSHFYNNSVGVGLTYKFGYIRKCRKQPHKESPSSSKKSWWPAP